MDLWDASRKVRDLFQLASEAAGFDVKEVLSNGTAEDLAATDKAQILITLVNLSAAALLSERGIEPGGFAGFSLGEYAALCSAGVLGVEQLFRIVRIRGELMEKASRELDAAGGKPGMAAVTGLPAEKVSAAVRGIDGVFVANHNSPAQLVLSGTAAGLSRAEELLKAAVVEIVRGTAADEEHDADEAGRPGLRRDDREAEGRRRGVVAPAVAGAQLAGQGKQLAGLHAQDAEVLVSAQFPAVFVERLQSLARAHGQRGRGAVHAARTARVAFAGTADDSRAG